MERIILRRREEEIEQYKKVDKEGKYIRKKRSNKRKVKEIKKRDKW